MTILFCVSYGACLYAIYRGCINLTALTASYLLFGYGVLYAIHALFVPFYVDDMCIKTSYTEGWGYAFPYGYNDLNNCPEFWLTLSIAILHMGFASLAIWNIRWPSTSRQQRQFNNNIGESSSSSSLSTNPSPSLWQPLFCCLIWVSIFLSNLGHVMFESLYHYLGKKINCHTMCYGYDYDMKWIFASIQLGLLLLLVWRPLFLYLIFIDYQNNVEASSTTTGDISLLPATEVEGTSSRIDDDQEKISTVVRNDDNNIQSSRVCTTDRVIATIGLATSIVFCVLEALYLYRNSRSIATIIYHLLTLPFVGLVIWLVHFGHRTCGAAASQTSAILASCYAFSQLALSLYTFFTATYTTEEEKLDRSFSLAICLPWLVISALSICAACNNRVGPVFLFFIFATFGLLHREFLNITYVIGHDDKSTIMIFLGELLGSLVVRLFLIWLPVYGYLKERAMRRPSLFPTTTSGMVTAQHHQYELTATTTAEEEEEQEEEEVSRRLEKSAKYRDEAHAHTEIL